MTSSWFFIVLEISLVACAVVSGVFLTFSDFVMRSLNGAKNAAGVEVMQALRDGDRPSAEPRRARQRGPCTAPFGREPPNV